MGSDKRSRTSDDAGSQPKDTDSAAERGDEEGILDTVATGLRRLPLTEAVSASCSGGQSSITGGVAHQDGFAS